MERNNRKGLLAALILAMWVAAVAMVAVGLWMIFRPVAIIFLGLVILYFSLCAYRVWKGE